MPQLQASVYGSRAPAYPYIDRQTGITGTALTLAFTPLVNPNDAVPAPLLLFKNGSLLDPGGGSPAYTLGANGAVTLAVAAISTDVFVAYYWYQSSGILR